MGNRTATVRYQRRRGKWRIILHASNGAKLGPIGQGYHSERAARRGFDAIRRASAEAVEVPKSDG